MSKKHYIWMADYIILEAAHLIGLMSYKDLDSYKALRALCAKFVVNFDDKKFDLYIENKLYGKRESSRKTGVPRETSGQLQKA